MPKSRTKQLDEVFAGLEESWGVYAGIGDGNVLEGLRS